MRLQMMAETNSEPPQGVIVHHNQTLENASDSVGQSTMSPLEVIQAWDAARAEARQNILEGRKPLTLAQELRYALMQSAANHPDAEIPYVLLVTAVKQGLLRPKQAYAVARQISDPKRRVEVLASLSDYLTEPQKSEALTQALAVVQEFESEMDQWWRLEAIVPHLTEPFLPQILPIGRKFEDPWYRVTTLVSLIPLAVEVEKALLLQETLVAARSAPTEDFRAKLLTRVVPYLLETEKSIVLEEAFSQAMCDPDPLGRALNLEEIALMLLDTGRAEQAYSAALAIPGYVIRVRALQKVAPHLPPDQQQEAFEKALTVIWEVDKELDKQMEVDESRSQVLAQLIPDLPESLRMHTLEQVQSSTEDFDRFWPLVTLAANLPEPWKNQAATEALAELADYHYAPRLVFRLVAVARHLTEPAKSQVLFDAYITAQAVDEPMAKALTLIEVGPYLAEDQKNKAFEDALIISHTLGKSQTYVLNQMVTAFAEMGFAEAAAIAIRAFPSELLRVRALADVSPTLVDVVPLAVYSIWNEVLQALSKQPRTELLKALPALRTILELLGDEQAGAEMTRVIQEVGQEWP